MTYAVLETGEPFSQTAQKTDGSAAVATQTGVAGRRSYITDISGSSDKAGARIVVKKGSTVIWQDRISNGGPYLHHFESPLKGDVAGDVSVTVDSTAEGDANLAGVSVAA